MTPTTIPDSAAAGISRRELDRAFVHGVAWTGLIKWATQTFSWVTTLVVARLLVPEDYGVLGVAGMVTSLLGLLAEFGIGTTIVLRTDLDARAHRELHTTSTLLGLVTAIACLPLASPLATFFDVRELRLAFPVMGLGFLITGFRTVASAILQKRLQFRKLALIDAAQSTTASIVAVLLAAMGWGYWALILPNLLGALVAALSVFACAPVSFGAPRFATITRVGGISSHLVLQRLAWFAYNQADIVIIGRLLGQRPLGLYTLAVTTATTGSEKANELVARVTTGVFSAAQASVAELRRYLLATIEFLALLVLPAGCFLGMAAEWVATSVFGAQWAPMAQTLRILAFAAIVKSLAPPVDRALLAMGHQKLLSGLALFQTVTLIAGFAVGVRWGIEGVAVAWLTLYPLVTLPTFVIAVHKLRISRQDLHRSLGTAVGLTALGAAVFLLTERVAVLWLGAPAFLATPLGLGAGCAAYASLGARHLRPRFAGLLAKFRKP